jgi:hypothetical protein
MKEAKEAKEDRRIIVVYLQLGLLDTQDTLAN